MKESSAILASPEENGIKFVTGKLLHRDGKAYRATVAQLTDHEKFVETFGKERLVEIVNGQGMTISTDRIGREAAVSGLSEQQTKAKIVAWLLGQTERTVREREVYIGPNGQRFSDKEAAENAWMEHYTK